MSAAKREEGCWLRTCLEQVLGTQRLAAQSTPNDGGCWSFTVTAVAGGSG